MRWTVRIKVRDALYDMPIAAQWKEEDKETPEAVAEAVLKALKDQNPTLVVVVRNKSK